MLNYIARHLARNKVTIMVFHKVPDRADPMAPYEFDIARFEFMLDFVRSRYQIISMRDALQGMRDGNIPNSCVCLTFDDGYSNWTTGVVPMLMKRRVPATFYITTGQFGGLPLWHERIRHAVSMADKPIGGIADLSMDLPIATATQKQESVLALENALKYQTLAYREAQLKRLEAQTGSDPSSLPRMSADQVREIHGCGFEIGAHSVDHPILSMCSAEEARSELVNSRATLERIVVAPILGLAYPNGRNRDFDSAHIRLAREAGYDYAVSTEPGSMTHGTPLFQIPRFTPWGPGPRRIQVQMSRNFMRPPSYQPEHGS